MYLVSYFVYLVATRLVKYTLHFTQRPQDIIHLPGLVLFNFLFSFMKVYCLFTLHVTSWGTRAGADTATDQVDEAIYKVHFADIPDVGEIGKDGLEKKSDDSFVVQVPFSPVKTKSSISLADSAFSSSSVPNVARDANVAAIPEEGIVVTVRAGKDEITPQGKGKTSPVRKRFN